MYILFRIFYYLASLKLLSKFWWLFYYLDFVRKPIVFKNLNIAFPELSENEKKSIAQKVYKNFAVFFEDTVDFTKNTEKMKSIEVLNKHFLQDALQTGKPVIIMSAHFGNWELGPKYIADNFTPIAAIMRKIDNQKINDFFLKIRSSKNIKIIYRNSAAKIILKTLIKEKLPLGILIDQFSRSDHAVKVKFFTKTKFNPAISKLAKNTSAIVIPTFSYKHNNKYFIEFQNPKTFDKQKDTIESFTQWQADVIENMIRKYPDQYYWFHNRWKDVE